MGCASGTGLLLCSGKKQIPSPIADEELSRTHPSVCHRAEHTLEQAKATFWKGYIYCQLSSRYHSSSAPSCLKGLAWKKRDRAGPSRPSCRRTMQMPHQNPPTYGCCSPEASINLTLGQRRPALHLATQFSPFPGTHEVPQWPGPRDVSSIWPIPPKKLVALSRITSQVWLTGHHPAGRNSFFWEEKQTEGSFSFLRAQNAWEIIALVSCISTVARK